MSCGNLPASVCQCIGSGSSKVCRQKTYAHVWRPRPKTAWDGCVRDRNQDYDTQNTALSFASTNVSITNINGTSENYRSATTPATSDGFEPHQFNSCPATLMPLSYDWTALNNKIDELQPNGNTNVTIGLSWGFHALTSGDPLSNASVPSGDLDKVIILLTDGDNTQNRWTTNQADIDARTQQACDNVKKANIKLYTIRVIDGNAALLQACATKPDMYLQRAERERAQRRVRPDRQATGQPAHRQVSGAPSAKTKSPALRRAFFIGRRYSASP